MIERIQPELDGGRHAVKRVVGDDLLVTADIYADGHDQLDEGQALLIRGARAEASSEIRSDHQRLLEGPAPGWTIGTNGDGVEPYLSCASPTRAVNVSPSEEKVPERSAAESDTTE